MRGIDAGRAGFTDLILVLVLKNASRISIITIYLYLFFKVGTYNT